MVELACCSSLVPAVLVMFEACWFGYLDYFASRTVRVVIVASWRLFVLVGCRGYLDC